MYEYDNQNAAKNQCELTITQWRYSVLWNLIIRNQRTYRPATEIKP